MELAKRRVAAVAGHHVPPVRSRPRAILLSKPCTNDSSPLVSTRACAERTKRRHRPIFGKCAALVAVLRASSMRATAVQRLQRNTHENECTNKQSVCRETTTRCNVILIANTRMHTRLSIMANGWNGAAFAGACRSTRDCLRHFIGGLA